MFFISNRTKASFYNNSQITFLVEKDCVDIIFKDTLAVGKPYPRYKIYSDAVSLKQKK